MSLTDVLLAAKSVYVIQRRELAEIFGFETRNKYSIETESGKQLGFAAEQQKGIFGFLFRQFLGHWRSFDVLLFDTERQLVCRASHPFRFYFTRIDVTLADGTPIGSIVRRFAFFTKKFDLLDSRANVVMSVASPIWRIWTFVFKKDGESLATIKKRWGGVLQEAFLDADRFEVVFDSPALRENERALLVVAGVFIDLLYFEKKAQ